MHARIESLGIDEYLGLTESLNPEIRGIISVNPALQNATNRDLCSRMAGPLGGVCISLKDNINTKGWATTMGSAFFKDYVPENDAVVVKRLKQAGATILSKANLHEFAFGATTQNPHHGLGRNAWNIDAIPGGSSGGSGSSVAARMCDASIGSDTGGSIRIPAALNGVAGLRPTHGSVPNTGSCQVSPAYDTLGPLARSVAEVAAIYEAIAGYDDEDPYSESHPIGSWINEFSKGIEGVRIGLPTPWCFSDIEPEVERLTRDAIKVLQSLGARVQEVEVPKVEQAQAYLMRLVHADAAVFHADRLNQSPKMFGADVLDRLQRGQAVTTRDYVEALQFKREWLRIVDAVFSDVDILLTPTCPVTAPLHTDVVAMLETTKHLSRFCYAWAFSGTPALSVPSGFAGNGLPAGIQLVAPRWQDARVLSVGAHYQQVTAHHTRIPPAVEAVLSRNKPGNVR